MNDLFLPYVLNDGTIIAFENKAFGYEHHSNFLDVCGSFVYNEFVVTHQASMKIFYDDGSYTKVVSNNRDVLGAILQTAYEINLYINAEKLCNI